jgi:gas vesicle protein
MLQVFQMARGKGEEMKQLSGEEFLCAVQSKDIAKIVGDISGELKERKNEILEEAKKIVEISRDQCEAIKCARVEIKEAIRILCDPSVAFNEMIQKANQQIQECIDEAVTEFKNKINKEMQIAAKMVLSSALKGTKVK